MSIDNRCFDVQAEDNTGSQAILQACIGGHVDCLLYLHESMGLHVGFADGLNGVSAAIAACDGGFVKCLEILYEKFKVVKLNEEAKVICLEKAIEKGHLPIVVFLKEKYRIGVKDIKRINEVIFHRMITQSRFRNKHCLEYLKKEFGPGKK